MANEVTQSGKGALSSKRWWPTRCQGDGGNFCRSSRVAQLRLLESAQEVVGSSGCRKLQPRRQRTGLGRVCFSLAQSLELCYLGHNQVHLLLEVVLATRQHNTVFFLDVEQLRS
jgi:hypothetical protein